MNELNKVIIEALNEGDLDVKELVDKMENLHGKYFCGTLVGKGAEVYTQDYDGNYDSATTLMSDYTQDNIEIEFKPEEEKAWVKWAEYIKDKEITGKGYSFGWYAIGGDLDDYDVYKNRNEEPDLNTSMFITLNIDVNTFDGDFDKIAEEMDKFVLDLVKKANIFKQRVR